MNKNKMNRSVSKLRSNPRKKTTLYFKIILLIVLIIFITLIYWEAKKLFNKNNVDDEEILQRDEKKYEYSSVEREKLEKLDYINEKIDYFKMENIDQYLSYKDSNPDLSNEKVVLYVNIGLDNSFYTNIDTSPNQNTNIVLVNKYYYLEENYVPQDLKLIDAKYRGKETMMTHEATIAFNEMAKDAKEQGYTIRAISGYRSYSYQKGLYERYSASDGIEKADTYSARAGYSEHQTGLAIDVDNGNTSYTSFGLTKEFSWMKENAYKYGFILRYTTENEFITGYKNEPWHYRYVGVEIATQIKNENISSYEEYYFMYLDK